MEIFKKTCKNSMSSSRTWKNHMKIRRFCNNFVLSNRKLKDIMNRMSCCIEQGLGAKTHPNATVKCWQTYVQNMPTGMEKGNFLALDLGGSNFRVLDLKLGPNKFCEIEQKTYELATELKTGPGSSLFDYIARCLEEFVTSQGIKSTSSLPLGFTFSFPMSQTNIDSGTLVRWTKGFNCDGVVNQDVVKLLNNSIKRIPGLDIKICAILNDTVGTLMSCAWMNPKARIGLIVGTGCNCCYVEQVKNVELYSGDPSKKEMVINLEWGAFGEQKELFDIITKYDILLDESTENCNQHIYEKMISGKYLGEILRLLLLDIINENLILDGKLPRIFNEPESITTDIISLIESDPPGTYTGIRKFLQEIGVENPSDGDCMNIRYVTECVSRRSAYLVAAGLATILNKMNEKDVVIGVDGSVYRYHPYYHQLLVDKINELIKPGIKFEIMLSVDGSGKGAAVLASFACEPPKE